MFDHEAFRTQLWNSMLAAQKNALKPDSGFNGLIDAAVSNALFEVIKALEASTK